MSATRACVRARNLIGEIARVRGQIDQERLRICAPLAQQPLGRQVLFRPVIRVAFFSLWRSGNTNGE